MSMDNIYEKYTVIETIKENSRGELFKVKEKYTDELYIIRTIHDDVFDYYNKIKGINCENIPKILDVFKDEKDTVIIEEFIDGITLKETLDNVITIANKQIIDITKQLCYALKKLHEKLIIHRDLKPSNIIISTGVVKLIDFDSARQYDKTQEKDTVYMGTVGYAAPEQYGFSQTDQRTDIYSLGVLMKKICDNSQEKNSKLKKIYEKCTQFNPDNRYQNVDEILFELNHIKDEKNKPNYWFIWSMRTLIVTFSVIFFLVILFDQYDSSYNLLDNILARSEHLIIISLMMIYLANLTKAWCFLPFMRSNSIYKMILGAILWFFIMIAVLIIYYLIVQNFYSDAALEVKRKLS